MMKPLLLGLIRLYRLTFSHLTRGACRHVPSCSAYAEEAVTVHGAWRGAWLALRRLSRCHPWGTHGFDPVPPAAPRGTESGLERAHTPGRMAP